MTAVNVKELDSGNLGIPEDIGGTIGMGWREILPNRIPVMAHPHSLHRILSEIQVRR